MSPIEARHDIFHPSPPQTLLYTRYGRRHVVFSLRPMSCWIVLQRHRYACLRAVKGAVSKLDVVLILLPTVTQPMTSFTKRSLQVAAVSCISHSTQRGQSRRETTFLVRYSKETSCPTASHLVKSSISNGLIRRDHTLSHRLENQYISSKNLICNPRVSPLRRAQSGV